MPQHTDVFIAVLGTKVLHFAFASRIFICTIIVLCSFLPKHHNDGFYPLDIFTGQHNVSHDKIILKLLSGFAQWDSQYIQFIAKHGYVTYESLAFFPATPLMIHILSITILRPLSMLFCPEVTFLMTAIILNNILFIMAAKMFYKMSVACLGNCNVAYYAALLFCCNPASIFFSVSYTESLYSTLTFAGMYYYAKSSFLTSSLLFGLSTLCRSNGIVNVGFVVFALFVGMLRQMTLIPQSSFLNKFWSSSFIILVYFVFLTICVFVCISPFLAYQFLTVKYLCQNVTFHDYIKQFFSLKDHLLSYSHVTQSTENYIQSAGYQLIDFSRNATQTSQFSWCANKWPIPYREIQKMWNVGFMQYFSWAKLPNFILCMPTLLLVLFSVEEYLHRMVWSPNIWQQMRKPTHRNFYLTLLVLPFIGHLLFLSTFGFFFINVEVLTRFLFSSSPVLLWRAALYLCEKRIFRYRSDDELFIQKETNRHSNVVLDRMRQFTQVGISQKFVILFFGGYCIVGAVLHSTGLPWT